MYFKITNEEECHHGLQYHDGIVEDILSFEYEGSCCPGGIYFSDEKNILNFLDYGVWIRQVEIPEDAEWVKDTKNKWRASKLFFHPRHDIYTIETVEWLIKQNVDIYNQYDTLFYKAVRLNNLEFVKYLFEKKTSDSMEGVLAVALDMACSRGFYDIALFLTKHVSTYGMNYQNCLYSACGSGSGNLEIVKLLISCKVDVTKNNYSAFRVAAINGHTEVVKFLMKYVDISAVDNDALHYSCYNGKIDVVKLLVDAGADISSRNYNAIQYAIQGYRLDVVKYFMEEKNVPHQFYDEMTKSYVTFIDFAHACKAHEIVNYLKSLNQ